MASYWYWRQLENETVINENTTNTFDMPEQGHLSGLLLKLQMTNLTYNYALDNSWPFQQTTLRMWGNGNVPLLDVRGRQLEAINFWESGQMPKNNLWDDGGNIQEAYAFIPFGRYLGDPDYGLILQNFTAGVQLKDENTISTTYFTDASCKYDIWALMRKNPEASLFSKGYFTKRQIITKDAASETQYGVKLPTINKLKQIHMFTEPTLSSNLPATTPFTLLNKIWLGIKSKDEYILNNVSATIFARAIHHLYGRYPETQGITKASSTADNFFDTMIYERGNTELTAMKTSANSATEDGTTFWERVSKLYAWTDAGARVSSYVYVKADGICYHGNVPLLMIDPRADELAYLDAALNKDVYVEFTEGSGSGNIHIVLDELQKTYPSGA